MNRIRLPFVYRCLTKHGFLNRLSLVRFYAADVVPSINQRVGVTQEPTKADGEQPLNSEPTDRNEPTKESIGVKQTDTIEEPVIVAIPQASVKSTSDEIPRIDVKQKNETTPKLEQQEQNEKKKPEKKTSWRGFFLALLSGTLLVGSGYYTLHWQIIDANADLIREVTKLNEIKTKEQLEEEEKRAREFEEEELLRRRNAALQLKRQEEERLFLERTKRDIVRNWNSIWQALGFAIQNTEEEIRQKEEQQIRDRILEEVEVRFYHT